MQKTEYGYRRAIRIGIICLIFALCMGEYAFGSVVVDEVLIGGQEEQAPVDAAPAAQESAEPDASQPVSEAQTKSESQSTMERQAKTADSYPVSELDTRSATPAPSSKVAGTPRPDTEAPGQEKFATCKQSGWHGDRSRTVQSPGRKHSLSFRK